MTARFGWPIEWVSALAFALGAVVVIAAIGALAVNVVALLLSFL